MNLGPILTGYAWGDAWSHLLWERNRLFEKRSRDWAAWNEVARKLDEFGTHRSAYVAVLMKQRVAAEGKT